MKGDIMLNLYRYISFEDFVNLVVLKKDRYNYPANWDDGYEGFLFSNMETEEEIKTLVSIMYNDVCQKNYNAVIDNVLKMADYKYITRAQCWTTHAESDAMWRIYSYQNKAVRIKTNYDKLLAHAKELYPDNPVVLEKIIYDADKVMDVQSQNDLMRASRKVYETYLHKRPAFSHESEYRILVGPIDFITEADEKTIKNCQTQVYEFVATGKPSIDEIINKMTELLHCACNNSIRKNVLEDKTEYMLLMGDEHITDFIEGVMVHPNAEDWYVNIIKELCEVHKLNFEGQSQIYKLKK